MTDVSLSLPGSGLEQEATGRVESGIPTTVSPAPGQTLGHNPLETVPIGETPRLPSALCY